MTLGEMIGIVKHTFSNKNDAGEKCQLTLDLDYRNASDNEIVGWLNSNRVIAFARPLSKLNLDEMKELDGQVFQVSSIGQKIKSAKERMLEQLYNKIANDPGKLEQVLAIMNENDDEDVEIESDDEEEV